MYKLSGTEVFTPRNPRPFPNNFQRRPFPPFFARDQVQNEDFQDEIDDTPEFGDNTHHQFQLPIQDVFDDVSEPETYSNKRKTPSKQTSSKFEHTENSINAPQPYLIGAAISPAIIPLTYYPIHSANFGASTTNGNSKKSSSNNNRPKPLKKPSTESHRNVVPYNAVPLVWYPANYPVYSSNLQRDFSPSHSKLHSTTKAPVIRQSSKPSNQIQTMNLAAYYGYLNHINSKQKHPI